MATQRDLLNRDALDALLTVATSERRWASRSQFAASAGVSRATIWNALDGRRGLSDQIQQAICEQLGVPVEAITVPPRARPGDLETVRLLNEIKSLRSELNRRLDELHGSLLSRNGG